MQIEEFKTEYLIIFDAKDAFCSNIKCFSSLLQSNSDISIKGEKLYYNDLTISYIVQTEKFNNDLQRYFHLKLICNDIIKISEYEQLLKNIRTILSKVSTMHIQTLWDDLSFYYAQKAYPLIHEIENLMRKLITKFMLTNVGVGWMKVNVPRTVKESIKKKGKDNLENSLDYLYETDFIQLSNFLFDEYQIDNIANLVDKLKSIQGIEDITFDELKSYVPKSNWERYFSSIVKCDHEYLKKRWELLYELRCKVAHNNRMNLNDYMTTEKLVTEIKEKLLSAIDNLDKINITSEDKENIAESIVINTNALYGSFILKYKKLEEALYYYFNNIFPDESKLSRYTTTYKIHELYKLGVLSKETYDKVSTVIIARNKIVHESNTNYSEINLNQFIEYINEIINELKEIDLSKNLGKRCVNCGSSEAVHKLDSGGFICNSCSKSMDNIRACISCGVYCHVDDLIGDRCKKCS